MASNHTEPATGDTAVMDGHVSPAISHSPVNTPSGGNERKASTSSGKGLVVHDEGANGGKPELKPIGIINEQNTCFLNSTFQAVSLACIHVWWSC